MAAETYGDTIRFSSGRTIEANHGIIGLSPELDVSGGYDRGIDWTPPDERHEDSRPDTITDADMVELANLMIERWSMFRAKLRG